MQLSFDQYLDFLRESMNQLYQHRKQSGKSYLRFKEIWKDLNDEDPFVIYEASIAATTALSDQSLYH